MWRGGGRGIGRGSIARHVGDEVLTVAVYGATGYTGQLVVAELRRRGLGIVISGRSADSLRRVAAAQAYDARAFLDALGEHGISSEVA